MRRLPPRVRLALQRRRFDRFGRKVATAPYVRHRVVDVAGLPGEWALPAQADPEGPAVLYLHGGGYTNGSVTSHRGLASHIAHAAKAPVLQVAYRLAPEHPFPAAVDDAVRAYRWLATSPTSPAAGNRPVAVVGDSAGGGLAVAVLVAARDALRRGDGVPLPKAGVLLSPWVDLTVPLAAAAGPVGRDHGRGRYDNESSDREVEALAWSASQYLAGQDARHPLASPVYADLSGLPPLLVQVGDAEPLLGEARRLAQRAEAAGTSVDLQVWTGMWHVWHFFVGTEPAATQAVAAVSRFLRARLGLQT